jgi:hypothetical protein
MDLMGLNRATELTPEVQAALDLLFAYRDVAGRDTTRKIHIAETCICLRTAAKAIVMHVPPCPTRTVAIRRLVEARMDCELAIDLEGGY